MKSFLKIIPAFSIFIFQFSFSFARTVTVPVHGLCVQTKEPVPLDIEWDESWFTEYKTTEYSHKIARIAALFSEISYVPVEKNPDSNPLIETYRILGFDAGSIEWNYILDYAAPITGNNQAAYSFASKEIKTPAGTKKLVFVVLRGTPLSANEWISNINVSDTTHKDVPVHEGFYQTAQNLHKSLIYYLLKSKISPDEAIFLITGHSRGAALANLLGVMLEDEGIITGEQLFVYTFASPNVSQEAKISDERYNFIWNIVNAEDIIPSVPPDREKWKWKKYGHTKVLINFWNTAPEIYENQYLPKINTTFSKLLLRDYSPFKTGPFIQIQVARILTNLYKTVENYYGNTISLRKLAEKIFLATFPEEIKNDGLLSDEKNSKKKKESTLLKIVQNSVNANTEGGLDYIINAFIDMHACETYLSILLNLDENEAFSDVGSTQIVLSGSYDLAVYDDEGKMLAQILDGSVKLYSLHPPAAVIPLPTKNVLGFPGNRNLNVVLLKDSILPTIIPYSLEHYDSEGKLLGKSHKHTLLPHGKTAIGFQGGEINFAREKLDTRKISKKETKSLAQKFGLREDIKFRFQPELSITGNRDFYFGLRTGSMLVFFNILGSISLKKDVDYYGLSLGLGHQHALYGRFLLDTELFNKFSWNKNSSDWKFSAVPTARLTLSYKPRRRIHFFAGCLFDFRISDFNESAFYNTKTYRITEKIRFCPGVNFGIRL
ncbi:MAG: lipase family protein [Treponema sp.]|nr:lipase family protein [Treponema sp.]